MTEARISADFIAKTLTKPMASPGWVWIDKAPRRKKTKAAPYPAALASDEHDPLHSLFLHCALAQKAARIRGEKGPSWKDVLAEEGIRTEADVLAYFAKRRLP